MISENESQQLALIVEKCRDLIACLLYVYIHQKMMTWKGKISVFSSNIFTFNDDKNDRKGGEKDNERLKCFGSKIVPADNCKGQGIKKALQSFLTDKNRAKDESLYLFFMSHGIEDYIFGSDGGKVHIKELLEIIDENKLKQNNIFVFVEACRKNVGSANSQKKNRRKREKLTSRTPNLILGQATQDGNSAVRNSKNGSYYIYYLSEAFTQMCSRSNLFDILETVTEKTVKATSNRENSQTPVHNLKDKNKHLYPYELVNNDIEPALQTCEKLLTDVFHITNEETKDLMAKVKAHIVEFCHNSCSYVMKNCNPGEKIDMPEEVHNSCEIF